MQVLLYFEIMKIKWATLRVIFSFVDYIVISNLLCVNKTNRIYVNLYCYFSEVKNNHGYVRIAAVYVYTLKIKVVKS